MSSKIGAQLPNLLICLFFARERTTSHRVFADNFLDDADGVEVSRRLVAARRLDLQGLPSIWRCLGVAALHFFAVPRVQLCKGPKSNGKSRGYGAKILANFSHWRPSNTKLIEGKNRCTQNVSVSHGLGHFARIFLIVPRCQTTG